MAQVTGPPPLIPSRAEHLRQREGLSAAASDPELARLLAQLTDLPEPDRAAARRVLAGLLRLNGK